MRKIRITKKEAIRYVVLFILFFIISMMSFVVDNIFWITASPEWDSVHQVSNVIGTWTGKVMDYDFLHKIHYIISFRIFGVLTNIRDIISAVLISFTITFFVIFSNELLGKRVFNKSFVE